MTRLQPESLCRVRQADHESKNGFNSFSEALIKAARAKEKASPYKQKEKTNDDERI